MNSIGGLHLSPLAWIGLVPTLLALRSSDRHVRFMLSGYLTCFSFLLMAMYSFLPAYFLGGAALILVGGLHLTAPFLMLYFFHRRLGWRKALWMLPLLWPAWEWFFLQSKLSLPLMALYLTQAPLTWLIQYIDIFGYNAISFWLILLNVLIVLTVDDWQSIISKPSKKKKSAPQNWQEKYAASFVMKRFALILLVMFMPPLLYNVYVQATLPAKLNGEVKVSLVQANTPSRATAHDSTAAIDLFRHIAMTDSLLVSAKPDLVVWPEAAVPSTMLRNEAVRQIIFESVVSWNTPLLTGTFDFKVFADSTQIPPLQRYLQRDYEIYNAAALITPQLAWMTLKENLDIGRLKIYRKQNLMPFTESVPFSDTYPVLSNLTLDLGDGANFSAGASPKTLLFATQAEKLVKVSPIICWDLLYPTSATEAVGAGADFVAALTNESRLGNKIATTAYEMEGFTRLRSIETRRSIAKCSTTGYTLFCDPFGRVYGKSPWWQQQVATANVQLSSAMTIFTRYPGHFPKACLIAVMLMAVFVLRKRSSR